MKQIEIGDIVYYEDSNSNIHKAKALRRFTNYTHSGKAYSVMLIVITKDKYIKHTVMKEDCLVLSNTEYEKELKRQKIEYQINQLQEGLNEL